MPWRSRRTYGRCGFTYDGTVALIAPVRSARQFGVPWCLLRGYAHRVCTGRFVLSRRGVGMRAGMGWTRRRNVSAGVWKGCCGDRNRLNNSEIPEVDTPRPDAGQINSCRILNMWPGILLGCACRRVRGHRTKMFRWCRDRPIVLSFGHFGIS